MQNHCAHRHQPLRGRWDVVGVGDAKWHYSSSFCRASEAEDVAAPARACRRAVEAHDLDVVQVVHVVELGLVRRDGDGGSRVHDGEVVLGDDLGPGQAAAQRLHLVLWDALLGCRKSLHFLHVGLGLVDVESVERHVQVFIIFFSLQIAASTLKFSSLLVGEVAAFGDLVLVSLSGSRREVR